MTEWPVLEGRATARGIDLIALPLPRLLNFLLALIRESSSDKDWERFMSELERPLAGETPTDGAWSPEAQGSAFLSAMRATGATPPPVVPEPSLDPDPSTST